MAALTLVALRGTFAVSKLPAGIPTPAWATPGPLTSVTRTQGELSIVCAAEDVPADVCSERGWRCLRVAGQPDFSMVGILASLLAPLAEAGIAVFVISTFDTDYLLVKADDFERCAQALDAAGHQVTLVDNSENAGPFSSLTAVY